MKTARRFFPPRLLAGAALFLLPLFALSAPSSVNSKFAGSYQSDPAPPNKPQTSMSLSLGKDGTATVTQDTGSGETTAFGHWTDAGNEVTVRFDSSDGKPAPAPMVFEFTHDGMQATTYDHAAWGKNTPPLAKKASSDWHNHHIHL